MSDGLLHTLLQLAKKAGALQVNIFYGDQIQNDRSQIIRQVQTDGSISQKQLRRNRKAARKKKRQ